MRVWWTLCWFLLACQQAAPAPAPVSTTPTATKLPGQAVARARCWQLDPQSPFRLVAEGLRDASVFVVGGRVVVRSEACPTGKGAQFWAIEGAGFTRPLPALAPLPGRQGPMELAGSWPDNLVVLLKDARHEQPLHSRGASFRWDGRAWQELLPPQPERGWQGFRPRALLDWVDGSVLLAQLMPSERYGHAVLPFVTVGTSGQPAPDLSRLDYPNTYDGAQLGMVEYAALSTHQVFALRSVAGARRGIVSLAMGDASGHTSVSTVVDGPEAWASLLVGRLAGKETLLVWGHVKRGGGFVSFVRAYDQNGAVGLGPAADLPVGREAAHAAGLAGGNVLLARGDVVERLSEGRWTKLGTLTPRQRLYPALEGDTLWTRDGARVMRLDAAGSPSDVPFLLGAEGKVQVGRIVPRSADEVWLIAESLPDQEDMIFSTKPLPLRQGCW